MFDEYGTKQFYLVEPEKIDYQIDHGNANVEVFKTYKPASEKGVHSGLRIQLNQEKANWFANHNNLILIKQQELYNLLGWEQ